MWGLAPTKNGAVTGAESNAAPGRPHLAPGAEELPPLVARSPLGIFDEAMTFIRIRPKQLLSIAALLMVPAKALAAIVPGSALRRARPEQIVDLIIENVIGVESALANIASYGFESLALFLIAVMYGEVAASWFVGQAPTNRELFARTFRRFHKLFAIWLIAKVLILMGGLLSMGIAGMLVAVLFAVTAPLMGAERMRLRDALQRSANLASAKLGQTSLVFIVTGLGAMLIRLAIKQSPSLILSQFTGGARPPDWIVFGITDVAGSVFAAAFLAGASVVLYLDLRVRREGIDLDLAIGRTFPRNRSRHIGAGRG